MPMADPGASAARHGAPAAKPAPKCYNRDMRTLLSILPGIAAALVALGCGSDGPTGPRRLAGYYQLERVAGQNLPVTTPPPCQFCPPLTVYHGDMVLHANGTYELGAGGLGFQRGTFRVAGSEVRLLWETTDEFPEPIETSAVAEGDSIVVFAGPGNDIPFVFRRATRAQVAISPGLHLLARINGAGPPLITYDTVINGNRFVTSVVFDSIEFETDVFYRRHRSEQTDMHDADSGVILTSSEAYMIYGSYEGAPGRVILRPFGVFPGDVVSDTLAVVGSALVRSTQVGTTTLEERYERP